MIKRALILIALIPTLLLAQSKSQNIESLKNDEFISKRKLTALVYSTFIPGAGQFYLGHKIKGTFFTLTTFGSLVATIVSQNNLVGGNERLENLEMQYISTMNWEKAEQIWQEMVRVKSDIDRDYKRRNLFLGITVGIWVANIIDVLFFTSEKGSGDIFGHNKSSLEIKSRNKEVMLTVKLNF